MANKYRKKPVVIEAMQYLRDENIHQVLDFVSNENIRYDADENEFLIITLEGEMKAEKYDYIIKGVQGEFYPCKPDIFEQTYEKVN